MTMRRLLSNAILLQLVVAAASIAASDPIVRDLQRAFKGFPSVEKVDLRHGQEAQYDGKRYTDLVVLTVNRLYSEIDQARPEQFKSDVLTRLSRVLKSESLPAGLVVIQDPKGSIYRAFPIKEIAREKKAK